jgi:hypothetical protein
MIIRYSDGSCMEGVLHRLERGTLRASVSGLNDAIEYHLTGDGWCSETGHVVTFEFTLNREVDIFVGTIGNGEARCAAGGDCVLRRASGSGAVN